MSKEDLIEILKEWIALIQEIFKKIIGSICLAIFGIIFIGGLTLIYAGVWQLDLKALGIAFFLIILLDFGLKLIE